MSITVSQLSSQYSQYLSNEQSNQWGQTRLILGFDV